jgi:PAS domain S-box-containing protein
MGEADHADDLKGLIDAVDLPIVVLGLDATVAHCNAAASSFLSLGPSDLGLPLRRIRALSGVILDIEELYEHVLAGGAAAQREVRTAEGAWYVVRTTPRLGTERQVVGAVLTFTNVTGLRASVEQSIREREYTKAILNAVIDPLVVLDADLRIQTANRAFHSMFQVSREDTHGVPLHALGKGGWDAPELRSTLVRCLAGSDQAGPLEIPMELPLLGRRTLSFCASRLARRAGYGDLILLSIEDISERRQAEETRSRLAEIVDSSDDAIVSETLDGVITSWNPAAQKIFGYTAAEAIGRHISLIVPEEQRGEQDDVLARLRRGEKVDNFQTERRARDGRRLAISLTVSPIRDAEGTVVAASQIARDVTDRVQAEQALRQRTAQFEILINEAPIGVYLVDADFRLRAVNPQASPMFAGVPAPIGQDFGVVMNALRAGQHAREIVARFRHTLETGEPHAVAEGRAEASDGSGGGYYQWQINRIPLPDGRNGVVCYFRDISEETLARQTLAESERSLAREVSAMNRLHEMVGRLLACTNVGAALNEVLDAAIGLVSADMGLVHLLNPHSHLLEVAAHRGFTDAALEDVRLVVPDGGTAYGRALASGERVVIEDVQADPRHPHGGMVAAAGGDCVQSTPLLSRSGAPLGVLSTHHRKPHRPSERDLRTLDLYARQAADFIERINVEEALRAADRRKDEFLATLAHELRNPLAPVRMALELVRRKVGPSPIDNQLAMIGRQVENLERIVDDLLEVSRITRGKIELRKRRLDVSVAVSSALESTRGLILGRQHEVSVALPPSPLFVEADPVRVEQVLTNVLANAAKYTDPGGRISISVERAGGDAEIRVRDSGIGISEEMLPRVFEMFEQGRRDLARTAGGLGIGLSIVKSLTELHGGTVVAASAGVGRGSEFTVRLPLACEEKPGEAAAPVPIAAGGAPVARRRILVVDDNADAAESFAEILRELGHEVRVANDGPTAITMSADSHADIIFLDIGLPGMDGYQVAREIRKRRIDTQLIALTGYGHESARAQSREAGFSQHLVKPPALEKIIGVLEGVVPISPWPEN